MKLFFEKYHGAGNDFIIIDCFSEEITLSENQINTLCDRRLGIGADGLMMLLPSEKYCFKMKYFNSDGKEGSMCGNGGRTISAFAYQKGLFKDATEFEAVDGVHKTKILESSENAWSVEIQLQDVSNLRMNENSWFLNTGSPHDVSFVKHLSDYDVEKVGKEIRWSERYKSINGVNANFVEIQKDKIFVRTFERGVEAETLSCGTGVTASAIAYCVLNGFVGHQEVKVSTRGGELKVNCFIENEMITKVFLTGPVKKVFSGAIQL